MSGELVHEYANAFVYALLVYAVWVVGGTALFLWALYVVTRALWRHWVARRTAAPGPGRRRRTEPLVLLDYSIQPGRTWQHGVSDLPPRSPEMLQQLHDGRRAATGESGVPL